MYTHTYTLSFHRPYASSKGHTCNSTHWTTLKSSLSYRESALWLEHSHLQAAYFPPFSIGGAKQHMRNLKLKAIISPKWHLRASPVPGKENRAKRMSFFPGSSTLALVWRKQKRLAERRIQKQGCGALVWCDKRRKKKKYKESTVSVGRFCQGPGKAPSVLFSLVLTSTRSFFRHCFVQNKITMFCQRVFRPVRAPQHLTGGRRKYSAGERELEEECFTNC